MTESDPATIRAETLIDAAPVSRFQIWICICCAMVLFVDGFNTQIVGFIMPQIAKAWAIPPNMLGPIFSSGLVGLFVGYILVAPFSTQIGDKKMMIVCTATFGVVTLLTTLARDPYTLIAARFVTGIGLGGAFPCALSMVGEYLPRRRRSTAATLVISGLSLGSTFAGLTAALMLNAYGWQAVLLVGGLLPLAITLILFWTLPESLSYVVGRQRDMGRGIKLLERIDPTLGGRAEPPSEVVIGEAGASSAAIELFRHGRTFGTLALWLAITLNLLVNYAMQNWLTTLLLQLGQSQNVAIATTTMINAGGILSGFLVGPLMDKLGVYRVLVALFVAAAGFVLLMGTLLVGPGIALLASSFCAGFCSNGLQKGAGAIGIYFYPAALRSTGTGWLFGVGRVGAIIGPLAVGAMLAAHWAPAQLFQVAAVPMLLGAIVIWLMSRRYGGTPPGHAPSSASKPALQ